MYKVQFKKTGRTLFNHNIFFTYERARQAARKHARKLLADGKALRKQFGMWDSISRNPTSLTEFYRIVRVD